MGGLLQTLKPKHVNTNLYHNTWSKTIRTCSFKFLCHKASTKLFIGKCDLRQCCWSYCKTLSRCCDSGQLCIKKTVGWGVAHFSGPSKNSWQNAAHLLRQPEILQCSASHIFQGHQKIHDRMPHIFWGNKKYSSMLRSTFWGGLKHLKISHFEYSQGSTG